MSHTSPIKTRTAIVTGGSTGIGLEICKQLLAENFAVINLARRAAPIDDQHLHNMAVDLADTQATKKIAEKITQRFCIDTLIHNAGLIRPAPIEQVALEDLDYLTQIHLSANIVLTQAVLPTMKEKQFGRIVNITSRAVLGLQTRSCYSATKAAQVALTRTWALELGQYGITVNAIAPGPIADTEMFDQILPKGSEKIQLLAAGIPVKRLGYPGDIARAVKFFTAEDSGFITGQTLFVCGGASIGALSI